MTLDEEERQALILPTSMPTTSTPNHKLTPLSLHDACKKSPLPKVFTLFFATAWSAALLLEQKEPSISIYSKLLGFQFICSASFLLCSILLVEPLHTKWPFLGKDELLLSMTSTLSLLLIKPLGINQSLVDHSNTIWMGWLALWMGVAASKVLVAIQLSSLLLLGKTCCQQGLKDWLLGKRMLKRQQDFTQRQVLMNVLLDACRVPKPWMDINGRREQINTHHRSNDYTETVNPLQSTYSSIGGQINENLEQQVIKPLLNFLAMYAKKKTEVDDDAIEQLYLDMPSLIHCLKEPIDEHDKYVSDSMTGKTSSKNEQMSSIPSHTNTISTASTNSLAIPSHTLAMSTAIPSQTLASSNASAIPSARASAIPSHTLTSTVIPSSAIPCHTVHSSAIPSATASHTITPSSKVHNAYALMEMLITYCKTNYFSIHHPTSKTDYSIPLPAISACIKDLFREYQMLSNATHLVTEALSTFDSILYWIIRIAFAGILGWLILGIPAWLLSLAGLIGSAAMGWLVIVAAMGIKTFTSAAVSSSASSADGQSMLSGILWILLWRPFDLGDLLMIPGLTLAGCTCSAKHKNDSESSSAAAQGMRLRVVAINLTNTIMECCSSGCACNEGNCEGSLLYLSNAALAGFASSTGILNLSRSLLKDNERVTQLTPMTDALSTTEYAIRWTWTVPRHLSIQGMQEGLQAFVQHHNQSFLPFVSIYPVDGCGSNGNGNRLDSLGVCLWARPGTVPEEMVRLRLLVQRTWLDVSTI